MGMEQSALDPAVVDIDNADRLSDLNADYDHLQGKLDRSGVSVEAVRRRLSGFELAIPTWGVGTGGTRFARFPQPGEPRHIFDKIEDCGVIRKLSVVTPRVSPHFPWDCVEDYAALREYAAAFGLGFDAVNSNTFQNQPDQVESYKFGSLSHTSPAVRAQAIAHNMDCIGYGKALGSRALTVWVGDGSNFPGQTDFMRSFDRYLDSMKAIYDGLPDDWRVFIEHKMFEPAFYSTVIQDWGSNILAAQTLGDKAKCLVDLGHHAPNTNIEMIVARLHHFGKLGGFHFNDSKYGDDDLDSGSIDPFRLFLVFNELVEAEGREGSAFSAAYMMDQSHNVTDPIESLMNSAEAIVGAYARALLVDRDALHHHQQENDVLMAHNCLKTAFETDVRPLVAMMRYEAGGAIDPIAAYRRSGYRAAVAARRPATGQSGSGIV
ncbi:L-rhamnose isomerase/sugar isomerase [Eilatimonas milleporae]|uniref:L-rhamnose isomerase/sugar isomerase n=2 Tax=Eilatimonas milleporae TaxID=911205 RepID=A0A3M0CV26_9PROT|nr:L-rhamnose isomerase/sugar isomerase [Eilatimonas milleporae]